MIEPQARFLTGSTMGHVIRMTVTGMIGLSFMFLVDAANLFWVSRLGQEGLVAALGFAFTIQFFSISSGIGLMIAVTATVSKLIGQGRREEARRQASVSMIVTILVQALVATLVVMFRHEILALAGAKGDTAVAAARYLLITVPSLPVMALGMVGSGTLRAEGDALRSMYVTLSSGIVAMIADPFLILYLDLGLDGAAYAVWLARAGSAAISAYFVFGVHNLAGPISRVDFRRMALPFLWIALPVILTQLSTPFGNYIVTSSIARFGDGAVAGLAVVVRFTVLAFGGIFALSGAIGGIIGQNHGAGQYERVQCTVRDALIFCAGYTALAWVLLHTLGPSIAVAFGLGADGKAVFLAFASYASAAFLFTGAIFVANAAFNNLGRPVYSTVINWLRDGVIIFPAVIVMGSIAGAPGVIYGQALAGVAVGIFATLVSHMFVRKIRASHQVSAA